MAGFFAIRDLKDFCVSASSFFMSSIFVTYAPTFWRIESWSRSIICSILFSRSSRYETFASTLVLKSIIFSKAFLISDIFSVATCSAISVIVSALIDGEDS